MRSDVPTLPKWLVFVEDPGAVTYIRPLLSVLQHERVTVAILAAGYAADLLASGGITADRLAPGMPAESVLHHYGPSLIIVGTSENPDTFAFRLIEAARTKKLTTVGIVDAAANVTERFRGHNQNALAYAPDWLIVPDTGTASAFHGLGFQAEKIRVCGHPRYDEVLSKRASWTEEDRRRHRRRWLPGADGDRRILLFVAETSTGLNASQYVRSPAYTLNGRPEHDGRTEIVLDELLAVIKQLRRPPYLVLRLHPKQGPDDLAHHRGLFDYVSKTEPALELVNASDAVVGMTSMLLLEAAILGRPTLSIVPRAIERDWLGTMASQVTCVWTREKLQQVLPDVIAGQKGVSAEPSVPHGSLEKVANFFRERLG